MHDVQSGRLLSSDRANDLRVIVVCALSLEQKIDSDGRRRFGQAGEQEQVGRGVSGARAPQSQSPLFRAPIALMADLAEVQGVATDGAVAEAFERWLFQPGRRRCRSLSKSSVPLGQSMGGDEDDDDDDEDEVARAEEARRPRPAQDRDWYRGQDPRHHLLETEGGHLKEGVRAEPPHGRAGARDAGGWPFPTLPRRRAGPRPALAPRPAAQPPTPPDSPLWQLNHTVSLC